MRKRKYLTCAFATLCLAFALPNKIVAQIGNPHLIYQAAYNNSMFLVTKGAIERGIRSRSEKSENKAVTANISSTEMADLSFTTSSQVHSEVVQSIAKIMAQGDNAKIKAGTDLLNRGNLLGEFDKLLRQYGFNSHDLADVFSAYVILSWQATTGNDAAKNPRGIEIFRKKMQALFGNNEEIRKFTNAQKQQTAETLSYIAVLVTLANQDLTRKGDAGAISQSHQNIRQATMKITGMDITKYTLSQTGFNLNEN